MSEPAEGQGNTVLAEFDKNKRERVRISRTSYRGVDLIDVRSWYQDGDEYRPGKGLSLRLEQLPELRKALTAAEKTLKAGAQAVHEE